MRRQCPVNSSPIPHLGACSTPPRGKNPFFAAEALTVAPDGIVGPALVETAGHRDPESGME